MQLVSRPNNLPAIRRGQEAEADFVPHLDLTEVRHLAQAAAATARTGKGERDSLLIQAMFDGALRISETLSLCPNRLVQNEDGWSVRIIGKGNKVRYSAISPTMANKLLTYAYQKELGRDQRIFPITPSRAWQIFYRAFDATGIRKPDGVGTTHVIRHSGAIERLDRTRNPKATQEQLGHKSATQTLRYLKTLSAKESLKIQQRVDFQW